MLYFAVHDLDADGGCAGHRLPQPARLQRLQDDDRQGSFFGERIQELGRIAAAGDLESGDGERQEVDVFARYVDRLAADYHGNRAVNVVWDAGNGVAGPAMTALADRLPGRHELLFPEVDGTFPNHHPDPTVAANLVDLIQAVREGGYEIGIAFDGDGDRIGVVDGKGRIVWGDQLLQILARTCCSGSPAPRSSPTSRRARRCSTTSASMAASR